MIRPFTLITMLLAAGSGAYLFGVKHRAQVLDDQLASVNKAAQLDAQRITVLQAQWAQETDPTRLTALAREFSTLQPMQPAQLVTVAALRMVLPPAASPPALGAAPVVASATASAPDIGSGPLEPESPAASALPLPPPMAPPTAPNAAAQHPVRLAARPVGHSVLHLAQSHLAENLPPPRPLFAPHPVPAFAAMKPAATMAVTPVSDESGSVLGMATDMAPPQPLPQGIGN
jgi:hypothetical protein